MSPLRHAAMAACAAVLASGAACVGEECSGAACATGPYAAVVLTTTNAGQEIPIPDTASLGVYLPGHRSIVSSNDAVLAPVGTTIQPPDDTFRIFRPVLDPKAGVPWAFGGKVTISSPGDGNHAPWLATVIVGTDPWNEAQGREAHSTYFRNEVNDLAVGQSFVMTWPLGYTSPSSSDESVLAPVTSVITVAEGGLSLRGRFQAIPRYQEQLFVGASVGSAVLTLTRDKGAKVCGINDTQNHCLETPLMSVRSKPNWSCSVDSGCVQVHWDGVSRDRPDQ